MADTDSKRAHCVVGPAMRELIAYHRERNWSIAAIAAKFDLTVTTVQRWCLVLGAEPRMRAVVPRRREGPVLRKGRVVHPFTAEDDALILALECQALGDTAIARVLTRRDPARPRRSNTIRFRIITLARHEHWRETAERRRVA